MNFLNKNTKICPFCADNLKENSNTIIYGIALSCTKCNFERNDDCIRHLYNDNILIGVHNAGIYIWFHFSKSAMCGRPADYHVLFEKYNIRTLINTKEDYYKMIEKLIKEAALQ